MEIERVTNHNFKLALKGGQHNGYDPILLSLVRYCGFDNFQQGFDGFNRSLMGIAVGFSNGFDNVGFGERIGHGGPPFTRRV
jgi:hypothetical protein